MRWVSDENLGAGDEANAEALDGENYKKRRDPELQRPIRALLRTLDDLTPDQRENVIQLVDRL